MDTISAKLADEIANDLVSSEGLDKQAALDPVTILAIAKTLLAIGSKCADFLSDINNVQNPGFIQRIRLQRLVKSNMRDDFASRLHLRSLFSKINKSIVNGILKRGKTATADEISQLIAEAKLADSNS